MKKTGQSKIVTTKVSELVVTEKEETEYRKIDDILKIEDALTRVQREKMKALKLKHDMEVFFNYRKDIEGEKLTTETALTKAKLELIKGSKKDTSLLEALIAAKRGDE